MLIDICMKFREDSLGRFQVIERRLLTDRQTDIQTDAWEKTICLPTLNRRDNDDPGLTFTNCMAISDLAKFAFCAETRPGYQVCVYHKSAGLSVLTKAGLDIQCCAVSSSCYTYCI